MNGGLTFYRYILALACVFAMPIAFLSMTGSYHDGDMGSYWRTLPIMLLLIAGAGQSIFLIR